MAQQNSNKVLTVNKYLTLINAGINIILLVTFCVWRLKLRETLSGIDIELSYITILAIYRSNLFIAFDILTLLAIGSVDFIKEPNPKLIKSLNAVLIFNSILLAIGLYFGVILPILKLQGQVPH